MGYFEFELVIFLFLGMTWIYFKIPRIIWDCGPVNLLCWSGIDVFRYNNKARRLARSHKKTCMDGEHAGIMICHQKRIPLLQRTDEKIYACGVDILIEHFLKHDMPFNVYDCYNREEGSRVIRDPTVTSLWIFGHGMKSGVYFGHNETLHYAEMHDAPRKDFIGQFHCNALGGRSLADYIGKEGCWFVEDGYRCTHQNRKAIQQLLRNSRLILHEVSPVPSHRTEPACAQ